MARKSAAVMLAATLTAGMVPSMALAQGSQGDQPTASSGLAQTAFDHTALADGTYDIAVSTMKATDVTSLSMMSGCVIPTATLNVENGNYRVVIEFQKMSVMGVEGVLTDLKYDPSGYTLNGNQAISSGSTVAGTVVSTWEENGATYPKQIEIPLTEQAKTEGGIYAQVKATTTTMGDMNSPVVFMLDWTSFDEQYAPEDTDQDAKHDELSASLEEAADLVDDGSVDYRVLSQAIAAAQEVSANPDATAEELQAQIDALSAAVARFNGSAAYAYQEGGVYEVPTSWVTSDGQPFGHLSAFLKSSVSLTLEDGIYRLALTTKEGIDADLITSLAYGDDDVVAQTTDNADGTRTYALQATSAAKALKVTFTVNMGQQSLTSLSPMAHNSPMSAYLLLDTANSETVSEPAPTVDSSALQTGVTHAKALTQGKKSAEAWSALQAAIANAQSVLDDAAATQEDIDAQVASLIAAVNAFNASADVSDGDGTNNNNGGGNNQGEGQEQEAAFEVGHTYQVPYALLKSGSTQSSMAAQYFGDVALVRPQADGSFDVRFSTNRPDYIVNMYYQGSALSVTGGDGVSSAEYRVDIPSVATDTVIPLTMTIKPMQQLGGGDVSADLHLYLSQAEDLGTGKDDVVASTDVTGKGAAAAGTGLVQTGDDLPLTAVVAGAACAGIAVAGSAVAVAARRRASLRK